MKKFTLFTAIFMIMITNIFAGDDSPPISETSEENISFIQQINGYIRAGYQNTDITGDTDYTDIALGGKLHIDTASWEGISASASFYTSNSLGKTEGYLSGAGMPFFDGAGNSYSILGEVYLQGQWGNTVLKAGRQEIDTPFADTDDIGMVPNTFEAVTLVNRDIQETTIVFAQLQKMAGVDAEVPGKFTKLNGNDGVQVFGVTYEGIDGLELSGWYYNANDLIKVPYLDAIYEVDFGEVTLGLGAQYAYMDWEGDTAAKVIGGLASIGFESTGLTLAAAYNKSSDGAANDMFGGGPFFTSSENLTLTTAGNDGKAVMLWAEWDAGTVGIDGVSFTTGYLTLQDQNNVESTELDLTASYKFNDSLSLDIFYSNIDDKIDSGDELTNIRVFVNYIF